MAGVIDVYPFCYHGISIVYYSSAEHEIESLNGQTPEGNRQDEIRKRLIWLRNVLNELTNEIRPRFSIPYPCVAFRFGDDSAG